LKACFEVFENLKQLEEFGWKLFSMIKYDNPFFNTSVVLLPPINTIVHTLFSFVNNQNNAWTIHGGWAMDNS